MTDTNPLTGKTCEDLPGASCITILTAPGDPDPYICPQYIADDMRAAADWQLEQVIEWLKGNLGSSMYLQLVEDNVLGESGTEVNVGYVIQHLREEMRPL